jgi:hypothetical protein
MLILATDMARHSEIMECFKTKLSEGYEFPMKDHVDTVIISRDFKRHDTIRKRRPCKYTTSHKPVFVGKFL